MNTTKIQLDNRNGNFHIYINGAFCSATAEQLCDVLKNSYSGEGNIFINTCRITSIQEFAPRHLSSLLLSCKLPAQNIYYKGAKASRLCHNYGRIIRHSFGSKKSSCRGKCSHCLQNNIN